jgi:hypothetical protein
VIRFSTVNAQLTTRNGPSPPAVFDDGRFGVAGFAANTSRPALHQSIWIANAIPQFWPTGLLANWPENMFPLAS